MVVFLFPGQGSQFPAMFDFLPDHPKMQETIARANAFLGENPYNWSTQEALQSTRNVQLSLLTIGVGCAYALMAEGLRPKYVAGHSVGAFSAAVAANVLSFEDALKIVKYRGEKMEASYPHGYGMGVIQGLSFYAVEQLLRKEREAGQIIYIANENSDSQIAVSGKQESIEHAFIIAGANGARKVQWLNVSVPSHTPLFSDLAKELDHELRKVNITRPSIPYVANHSARLLQDEELIREDLAFNIEAPVRWHNGMTMLYERGIRQFLQLPPGRVYTELVNQTFADIRALSLANDVTSITNFFKRCV
ncbi:malonate decarboxylase subunit epsilon [Salicibibacter cibi]|uniref:Malonyl CoA-acyl carrier protein transacylase n=1 Tax=Salicibibacter cibi TaxID=2743001 RepID=A0A7T6Z9E1_9BACI|nr:malonate decarboxylase subunit epsilon [Salicibibacter cibi]QQK79351.1 malonate decarboxylase subunit epsilon [Salicibibacter cibi]